MPTIFSTSPHFDDYDQTKQFVRILFRPGRAVQARELTQLQTIIQGQVERFGKGIYKDGSFVTPPEETYDPNYAFVKLKDSLSGVTADSVVATLVDQIVVGQSSGVRALVVNSAVSTTAGDPPTIFVKYIDGGTNNQATFSDNEQIRNVSGTISVNAITTSATGNGTAFSIGQSTMFARGNFLYVPQQTHIISKYASVTNKLVGFNIAETVITSDDDSSLLDPASGTFNFFAPGADRYKAALTLTSRDLEFTSNTNTNFVEIIRIENGEVISKNLDPKFSVLGDTLAKRTFEESGNYNVTPFSLDLKEHLRSGSPAANAGVQVAQVADGVFYSSNGGNAQLFVAEINPGKAYVKGYEVNNIGSKLLPISKARDFVSVTNGVVASNISSHVLVTAANSIPDFENLVTLNLLDRFKEDNEGTNGTIIGTAKSRGFQLNTGNVAAGRGGGADRTAQFQLHLFDVTMDPGKQFDRDVKQVTCTNSSYTNFAANVVPVLSTLTGAVTITNASTDVTGSGTRFSTELKVGDVITVSNSTTTQNLLVSGIESDVILTVTNAPSVTIATSLFSLNTANIRDSQQDKFFVKLPYDVIKSQDENSVTYSTKRIFSNRQLGQGADPSGSISFSLPTGQVFAPFSSENYHAVIVSGSRAGEFINIQSGDVTRGGSPTGTTITFDFSTSESLSTEFVTIYAVINKTNPTRKTKTLVENATIDFINRANAQSSVISLQKADGFKLKSVKMANVNLQFGNLFSTVAASNITSRYTFDNGQKSTFYDVAKIRLKPGQAKPERPIRVTFDYFTHGAGDYFSTESYASSLYGDIPTFTTGETSFQLRDVLDFRPRISDDGTGFSGTGSSKTEFLDPETDFITDFQYFLPRTDSVGIDENGNYFSVTGTSSLNPKEPDFPSDLLKLFVLAQKPYVFDVTRDIDVKTVENKRFTMKDIGRLENRVKTLEFYTSLDFLERNAQQEQIQDELGLERFKNGFIVDSFTGHGVGDSIDNPDYAASVNFTKKEAQPLVKSNFITLKQKATSSASKSSNNYVQSGDFITLPYTEEVLISNPFTSGTQNLNPFNIGVYQGLLTLDPPGDLWFDDKRVPDILVDQTGTYDSLSSQSLVKKNGDNIFGTINDIEQIRNGIIQDTDELPENLKGLADLLGSVSPSTSSIKLQGNEVVKNVKVVPKMRNVVINFDAKGMRPNTNLHAFFDDINVDGFVTQNTAASIEAIDAFTSNTAIVDNFEDLGANVSNTLHAAKLLPLQTDSTGSISGFFSYSSSSLNVNTGKKIFRLTSSSSNDPKLEITYAEAIFVTDGLIREIGNEVLRPPPDPQPRDSGPSVPPDPPPPDDLITRAYDAAASRLPDAEGLRHWGDQFGTGPGDRNFTNLFNTDGTLNQSEALDAARNMAVGFLYHGQRGEESGFAALSGEQVNKYEENGRQTGISADQAINAITTQIINAWNDPNYF